MPESNFSITQGTGTVVEQGNSIPYTGKLDALSKHPVAEIINGALKDDCVKALDIQAYTQFNSTKLRATPASSGSSTTGITLTTNGTATNTNSVALTKNHLKAIVDTMKERNIPAYSNTDEYFGVARTTTWRQLRNDLEAVYQYRDEGFGMIYRGEIGKYEGVRLIEQNNIASAAWSATVSDKAFFFGNDTVAEAIVVPEEIRGKIPGDYGRNKGIAWYYLGGSALIHTTALNARIVCWDSAA